MLSRSKLGRRLCRHLPRKLHEEGAKIRRIFAAGRYDLIYSNTITNGAVLEALTSFKAPVLTHVHELEYWIARAGAENIRRVLASTTAFLAASHAVSDNLVRNHAVPPEKITVIHEHIRALPPVPSAAEKSKALNALGIPAGAFVIGGCGAEHWRKGRDLIPQLLTALRRHRPDRAFHFLWIGRPGDTDEEFALQYDLRHSGVEAFFHSTGEVENPFQFSAAMDAFALLSRDDPYPLACLEVAAMEKPVVCFANAGGMPEFVRDGCGFIAPYLDVDAMARDLVRLATDPILAHSCGRLARAKVARENTLDVSGSRLLSLIKKVSRLV